ncbi:Orotate phosphoribosyltransferase [bacterium HR15]|nr:Orotate phosphoribosyltransferase [bacterium HR15]
MRPVGEGITLEELTQMGAILHGHFLLTSGRHSAVYFEKFRLLERPALLERVVATMLTPFRGKPIEGVVGPTLGGILVAYEAARQLGVQAFYAEREGAERAFRRNGIPERGMRLLVVDDVLTTGSSIREVLTLLQSYAVQVVGIGVLIDRSEQPIEFGYPLAAALRLPAESYPPDECPLCLQGIPLLKRGSR